MKKIFLVMIIVSLLGLCGCRLYASETKVIKAESDFLEIISQQEIQVKGYRDNTTIIKCKDKETGNIIYIMQGFRKGGISVVSNSVK